MRCYKIINQLWSWFIVVKKKKKVLYVQNRDNEAMTTIYSTTMYVNFQQIDFKVYNSGLSLNSLCAIIENLQKHYLFRIIFEGLT